MQAGTPIASVHVGPSCVVRSCPSPHEPGRCYCAPCGASAGANPAIRPAPWRERRARELAALADHPVTCMDCRRECGRSEVSGSTGLCDACAERR